VDVVADFPADTQPAEPVQECHGLFHDPADLAESGAVFGAFAGQDRGDAEVLDGCAVRLGVVGPVGVHRVGSVFGPAYFAAYGWDGVDEFEELGDVVAVAAGQDDGEWDARAVGDDVVFRAGLGAVDRTRTRFGPPFIARRWELSTTAFDQSSWSAPRSSASSTSCSRCQTPAACHASSRRQQVIPDPNPSSWGRNSHWMPVCSTNRMPHNTFRSGNGLRPG
jgi:hypothetical protein